MIAPGGAVEDVNPSFHERGEKLFPFLRRMRQTLSEILLLRSRSVGLHELPWRMHRLRPQFRFPPWANQRPVQVHRFLTVRPPAGGRFWAVLGCASCPRAKAAERSYLRPHGPLSRHLTNRQATPRHETPDGQLIERMHGGR